MGNLIFSNITHPRGGKMDSSKKGSEPTKWDVTKAYLNKAPLRAAISAVADIAIAVYTAVFLSWNSNLRWWGLGILIAIDLVIICFYATQTSNSNAAIDNMKKELEYDDQLIANMERSCEITVNLSDKVIKQATETSGELSLREWNFRLSCTTVVHKIYDLLREYKRNTNNEFELCYDRITKGGNGHKFVETIACYTSNASNPSIIELKREATLGGYYDAEYIYKGHSEIECLMTKSEIKALLGQRPKINGTIPDIDQYNQIFLVPVLKCKTELVGLFMISCLNETELGDDKDRAKRFIQKKIVPFLKLLLVFYRLEEVFVLKEITEENNGKKISKKKVYN